MSLIEMYKDFMRLNETNDLSERENLSKQFFEKLNYITYPEYFNWVKDVFEGIHVSERGDNTALLLINIDNNTNEKFTYKDVSNRANKILNLLRQSGVTKADNIYLMIPAVPEIWFFMVANIKGGLITIPTATNMTQRELEYRFKSYPPNVLVTESSMTQIIDKALETTNTKPKIKIVIGEDRNGWVNYTKINDMSSEAEAAKTKPQDIIFCLFTSATTGMPKKVAQSAVSYPVGHMSTANLIGITTTDIHNNLSSPGWAKWAWSSFFAPLIVGATTTSIYTNKKFDPEKYLQALADYNISTFCAPPTAYRQFILQDLNKFNLTSLRECVSAGEPLNPEVIQKWKHHTGITIRDIYGQTETTAMIGNPPWFKNKIKPGSFGVPHYMYDIILTDDYGNEIKETNEVGNIVIRLNKWRAVGLFQEYIGDKALTNAVLRQNLYFTGDEAYIDTDGYWYFVSRGDDIIKSSDYRVGPFEVESALMEHEAVAESAVVGSPDPIRWQLVKAYIILKPGYAATKETANSIFQKMETILPKYKIPRIIEFVDELPKTISGKIRRKELKIKEEEAKKKGKRGSREYYYSDLLK